MINFSQQIKRMKQMGTSLRPRWSALPSVHMSHAEGAENAKHTSLALVCAVRMASTSEACAPLCSLRPLRETKRISEKVSVKSVQSVDPEKSVDKRNGSLEGRGKKDERREKYIPK